MMTPEIVKFVLIANAAATWWMTAIVWFCAIVHYPLFDSVGRDAFMPYHAGHVRRTQRVVLVPMVMELGLSGLILFDSMSWSSIDALDLAGFALVIAVWCSTFFWQVPDHDRLSKGFDSTAHRSLVKGNLVRSLIWSCHALVVAMQCLRAMA